MSEDQEIPDFAVPDASTAAALAAEPEQDGGGEESERSAGSSEAARHRKRARAAEAERDKLAAQIESLRRGEVERLAADRLSVARDVFDIGGVELDELLDDAGVVDAVRVSEAVSALLTTRPGLAKDTDPQGSTFDYGQGKRGPAAQASINWTKFLGTK